MSGTAIYQLPIVAVLLSAWYGGRGPGLLASAICITGVSYWFLPPVKSFEISPDHVLPFSIFVKQKRTPKIEYRKRRSCAVPSVV